MMKLLAMILMRVDKRFRRLIESKRGANDNVALGEDVIAVLKNNEVKRCI